MALIVPILLAIGSTAHASESTPTATPLEVRPFVGAFVPTGDQRTELKSSVSSGAQLSYALPIPLQLVGTMEWAPSHDKLFSDARTDIYQYDAGLEYSHALVSGGNWKVGPFIGAGLGGRNYQLKNASTGSQTDFDGYGAIGGEASDHRLGTRIELRDYVSRFNGVAGREKSSTRNDLMLAGALTIRL